MDQLQWITDTKEKDTEKKRCCCCSYKPPLITTCTSDWSLIANQNDSINFYLNVDLRYGPEGGPFNYLYNVTGEKIFNNSTFGGDPAPNQFKRGWYRCPMTMINTCTANWTEVGDEGTTITCNIPVDLRYGPVGGPFNYLFNVTGLRTFNIATFGDPAPEQPKKGFYRCPQAATITNLFNTGSVLGQDLHYTLISSTPSRTSLVTFTHTGSLPPNDTISRWITASVDGSTPASNTQNFTMQSTFQVSVGDMSSLALNFYVLVDDIINISLNGVPKMTVNWQANWIGPLQINTGFVTGTNTLTFTITNTIGNEMGIRIRYV